MDTKLFAPNRGNSNRTIRLDKPFILKGVKLEDIECMDYSAFYVDQGVEEPGVYINFEITFKQEFYDNYFAKVASGKGQV